MYKNKTGQKLAVYAFDSSGLSPITGDANNITAYISKDGGAAAALNDEHPAELSAANMPGVYIFDLTQAETNADCIVVAAKSTTSGVRISPAIISLLPSHLETAVQQTVNKIAYDKSSGIMTVYDDDGSTPLFTQSMTGAGTVETRNRNDG